MIGTFGFISEYSLQESAYKLSDIISDTSNNGYSFIALSDFNNLYGAYKLFKDAKMKVIIGMKLDILHLGEKTSILCYAMNEKGYENLIILSTKIKFKQNEYLELDEIIPNEEGLFFLSAGIYSDIDKAISYSREDEAKERLASYKKVFKYFAAGLSLQSMTQEFKIAPVLKELSKDLNILVLPLNFMAYKKGESDIYDAIIQIQDRNNKRVDNMDLSFLSIDELKGRYFDYKEVFLNLEKVKGLFKFKYEEHNFELPSLKEVKNPKEYLKRLALEGLDKRIKFSNHNHKNKYIERLIYELEVISELGFDNYFLIVWDFIKYAKSAGILVGPGRGSAAGSLVSYALNITDVDPLKYGLLFERFLNKERATMPDIDLDFPDDRREEVIDYIMRRFGKYHVLSINTFSRFSSKAAIRDVCRIKGLSASETNIYAKRLAVSKNLTAKEQEIYDLALKFDGLPRQTGTHAAGIVVGKEDLRYFIPLEPGSKLFQSQFDHDDLTSMGLLKIDLLGIRNLTMIMRILSLIKEIKGIDLNLNDLNFDDEKTYKLLQEGDTLGIFQLESAGMRNVLRKLKPSTFDDIIALLALYRPGPLENIDTFINRRHGKKFTYDHPSLESILKDTYGIIIYQEQIMLIAQTFAGYSLSEADLLRVGISKKDKVILNTEKERFISKSIKNGKTKEQAEQIYDYIVKFADYGFNKSHSVAYSIVAYQMAYLKANYYEIFMATYLSMMGSDTNIGGLINTLKQKKVYVLPPHINSSTDSYKITEKGLIYPLTGIKNIGIKTANDLILERDLNGPFKDYESFKERTRNIINERILDNLIFSGALDIFGKNKKTLFNQKEQSTGLYESLLKDVKDLSYEEYDASFLAEKEKEALGFYLTKTPDARLNEITRSEKLTPLKDVHLYKNEITTAGYIFRINKIKTKQNKDMAFITLTDQAHYLDVSVFSETYTKYQNDLTENHLVVVKLAYQNYQGGRWSLKSLKVIKED